LKYPDSVENLLNHTSLGHEFVTDILKLQFHPKINKDYDILWFSYSLSYALVEGASEILAIPRTDLETTVSNVQKNEENVIPSIILYDNVPGGAGLVSRLEDQNVLKSCLIAAKERVSGQCGCDELTSCYGCLRGYRNQFAHHELKRGPVFQYLEKVISEFSL